MNYILKLKQLSKIFMVGGVIFLTFNTHPLHAANQDIKASWWDFQSVDTMKISRDLAREKKSDNNFDAVIQRQVKQIADTGATHIAIGTPYDEEFLPYLNKWVLEARKNDLNVWFRGNWSGWEGWFDYPKISREEHISKTSDFIKHNPELFENGDIFSACPECENGGSGDPRNTGDVAGYRKFLIDEYIMTSTVFRNLGLNIQSNYASMNADIARLIMDEPTTKAMGGLIVIDHFVESPDQLALDIRELAFKSNGKIVLGEYGAPVPDIHGQFTQEQQAQWTEKLLSNLIDEDMLVGLNYWTGYGGSTHLWQDDGTPRQVVQVINKYYSPNVYTAKIVDELDDPIIGAEITGTYRKEVTDKKGEFSISFIDDEETIYITAKEHADKKLIISNSDDRDTIIMKRDNESIFFLIRKFLKLVFS